MRALSLSTPRNAIEEERTPVFDVLAKDFDGMIEHVECVWGETTVSDVFESIGISPYSFEYRREDDDRFGKRPYGPNSTTRRQSPLLEITAETWRRRELHEMPSGL